MALEVVTHRWCDVCLQNEDEEVHEPGTEVVVQINALKARKMDLCDRCRKEWIDPLIELIRDFPTVDAAPTTVKGSRNRGGGSMAEKPGHTIPCKIPDCTGYRGGYKHLKSFRAHLSAAHPGVTLDDYRRQYGEPEFEAEPSGDQMLAIDEDAFTCGIDGCQVSYSPQTHTRPSQALGVHKAQAHGIRGKAKKKADSA